MGVIFSEKTHQMIVKIMKGDKNFRDATKSSTQCSNEVYIYKNVIPYFKKFISDSGATTSSEWVPRVYYADYKVFPELGTDKETVLALENLKPAGYRLGPRIDLDEAHLEMMVKHIASYHAVSFAMRIKKDPMLEKLAAGIIPLSFIGEDGNELESYKILFTVGMERLFNILEKDPKFQSKTEFLEIVKKFKTKFFGCPSVLMQQFLMTDPDLFVINHGDYNRNNVLFQYEKPEGFENLLNMKMIDFQEIRYTTPANDLSFFMYMNLRPYQQPKIWTSLLETYHKTMIASISDILKCSKDDQRLAPYSFENFLKHFKKVAFYGVMVGIHFIPWMACSEEECKQMSHLFETDIRSPELRSLAQVCGGANVDERITSIVLHAFENGYMDIFN